MKKSLTLLVFLVILLSASCIMRFPEIYKDDYEYGYYRIILKVTPDDAHVLLNGKFVGEAYEFATHESALKLRSANNSLVIKKRGYIEQEIDLTEYHKRKIEISIALKPDRLSRTMSTVPGKKRSPSRPEIEDKSYKVVKEKKMPKNLEDSPKVSDFTVVELRITPSEASIYLDGKFWGVVPPEGKIDNFSLERGKHKIEVVKPGFKAVVKNIDVKSSKKIKLEIKLSKK